MGGKGKSNKAGKGGKGGKGPASSPCDGGGGGGRLDPKAIEFVAGDQREQAFELGIAIIRGYFTAAECDRVGLAPSTRGTEPISDRDADLEFRHTVFRIEKAKDPALQAVIVKAIGAIEAIDNLYWRQLRHCNRKDMHPEVEFISYEVKPGKPLPGIEPHVDNASVITMVAMMADRNGYTGGVSCFERGRRLRLERGDVVFFRGELCEHWIEPVETGFRAILQIEMCRMKNGRH